MPDRLSRHSGQRFQSAFDITKRGVERLRSRSPGLGQRHCGGADKQADAKPLLGARIAWLECRGRHAEMTSHCARQSCSCWRRRAKAEEIVEYSAFHCYACSRSSCGRQPQSVARVGLDGGVRTRALDMDPTSYRTLGLQD